MSKYLNFRLFLAKTSPALQLHQTAKIGQLLFSIQKNVLLDPIDENTRFTSWRFLRDSDLNKRIIFSKKNEERRTKNKKERRTKKNEERRKKNDEVLSTNIKTAIYSRKF